MKTNRLRKRSGITQSMDLFILIAIVLAAGGIVAAAAFGLIGTSTSQSSVAVQPVSLTVGSASSSFSITIKDAGTTSFNAVGATVVLSGLPAVGTTTAPTLLQSGSTWAVTTPATTDTQYTFTASSLTLHPGETTAFAATFAAPALSIGASYTVTVLVGTISYSTVVTAVQG